MMNHRKLTKILMFAAAGAAAALLGGQVSASHPQTNLTFFIWAGSNQGVVPREVIGRYTKAHPNVKIDLLESNNTITYPKMVAARKTTPDQPLVHCGFFNVSSMTKGDVDDMWESLNPQRIPRMKSIISGYERPENKGVAYQISSMGLMYNKDKVKTPPTSWSALWDPQFKGRVVQFDYNWEPLVLAARFNGGSVENIDPGFKLWSERADQYRALVDSNDALKNLIVSGDAWIAPWFGSLASIWAKEGAPVGYVIPKEGAIAFPLYLAIAKGVTPAQRAVCEELINDLLSPLNAGRYAELTSSIPAVKVAILSSAQRKDPHLAPSVAKNAIKLDYGAIARKNVEWKERWDREVKSKMR